MDFDSALALQEKIRQLLASDAGKVVCVIGVDHSDPHRAPQIIDPRAREMFPGLPPQAWSRLVTECSNRQGTAILVGAGPYVKMQKALAPAIPGFSQVDPSFDGIPAVDLPAF